MLTAIRVGNAHKSNVDFSQLSARYLFSMPNDVAAMTAASFINAPIIVPTNEARHAFNRIILANRSAAAASTCPAIRLDAELERKRGAPPCLLHIIKSK